MRNKKGHCPLKMAVFFFDYYSLVISREACY